MRSALGWITLWITGGCRGWAAITWAPSGWTPPPLPRTAMPTPARPVQLRPGTPSSPGYSACWDSPETPSPSSSSRKTRATRWPTFCCRRWQWPTTRCSSSASSSWVSSGARCLPQRSTGVRHPGPLLPHLHPAHRLHDQDVRYMDDSPIGHKSLRGHKEAPAGSGYLHTLQGTAPGETGRQTDRHTTHTHTHNEDSRFLRCNTRQAELHC